MLRQVVSCLSSTLDHVRLLTSLVIPVVSTEAGDELTIWDSKESEFSLGLEFRQVFR